MIIKTVVRKILESLGYDLVPLIGTGSKVLEHKRESIRIELVGPSGVGKTTVSRYFLKNFSCNQKIISRQQLIENHLIGTELSNIHLLLLDKKIKNISKFSISPQIKIDLIKYFERVIIADLSSQYVGKNRIIFLDEGIIHNFAPELGSNEFNFEKATELFRKRLVCFCLASENHIIENIKKRNNLNQPHLSIKQQIKFIAELQECMKTFNLPFIELDLQNDSLKKNSEKIKAGILDLISQP